MPFLKANRGTQISYEENGGFLIGKQEFPMRKIKFPHRKVRVSYEEIENSSEENQ